MQTDDPGATAALLLAATISLRAQRVVLTEILAGAQGADQLEAEAARFEAAARAFERANAGASRQGGKPGDLAQPAILESVAAIFTEAAYARRQRDAARKGEARSFGVVERLRAASADLKLRLRRQMRGRGDSSPEAHGPEMAL